ncbi:hypothetical protein RRG08_067120, partial [Elysia crispata]
MSSPGPEEDVQEIADVSAEEEATLHELFETLDMNKDGKLDMNDLTKAMTNMQVPQVPGHAK